MKVCIPTSDDLGLKSAISGHFGGAPFFLIVDTDNRLPAVGKEPERTPLPRHVPPLEITGRV